MSEKTVGIIRLIVLALGLLLALSIILQGLMQQLPPERVLLRSLSMMVIFTGFIIIVTEIGFLVFDSASRQKGFKKKVIAQEGDIKEDWKSLRAGSQESE